MSNRLKKHKNVIDELTTNVGEKKTSRGRPVSRKNTVVKTMTFDKQLWERLKLASILKSKTTTDLLHEAIRAYLTGNFNKTDLDALAKMRQDHKD